MKKVRVRKIRGGGREEVNTPKAHKPLDQPFNPEDLLLLNHILLTNPNTFLPYYVSN